jgi:hypothetical protein
MKASSTSDPKQFGPHQGRISEKSANTGWCSAEGKLVKEYLEIDLGRDMRVSAVATQGVRIWNTTTQKYVV